MAPTSRPGDAATARSRIDRASFSVIVPRADRELPEAGGSRSVCHLGHLAGLSFAAVDDAPWSPRFRAADEVARVPEAGGDSLIRRVPEHPHALPAADFPRSEEHTSELQSLAYLVCRLLLEKKKKVTARQSLRHIRHC